jgi:hypothetical protein
MPTKAITTPTTPDGGQVIYVSRNFAIDTATRELGEAHPVLKIADDNLRQFEKCLELLRSSGNRDVSRSAQRAFEMLGDLRHDVSWATIVDMAEEAAAEARVVPMIRKAVTRG